jgi:8-oxo-dGTP pyrophosphatase MutT (NUDIX family)
LNWLDRLPPRRSFEPPAHEPVAERQSGVVPYALIKAVPVFLLITSRRTGRWIYPKGSLAPDLEPWESAAREARAEAGIEGDVGTEPVGSYRSWKMRGIRRLVIEVEMYPLRVEQQLEEWGEKGQRHRHWVTLSEARRLITQKRLLELTELVAARLSDTSPPAHQADTSRIAQ